MALIQGTYNFIPEILRGTDLVDTFVLGSGNEYVFGGAGEDVALFPLFFNRDTFKSASYYPDLGIGVIITAGDKVPLNVYYIDGVEVLQTLDASVDLRDFASSEFGFNAGSKPSSAIEGAYNETLFYTDRIFNTFFPFGDDVGIVGNPSGVRNTVYLNFSSRYLSINQRNANTTEIFAVIDGEIRQRILGSHLTK